ncbi:MAG: DUF981 family protein [Desulfurococcales archaeon]
MALFVDLLTAQLFSMAAAFILTGYSLAKLWVTKNSHEEAINKLKPFSIPALILGAYITITGLYGSMLWPLPGSYNLLFYDLYPLLGLGLIGIAMTIRSGYKLEYMGFLALILGLITAYYGYMGYANNLTKEPFALFLLYGGAGLSSILFYPISYQIDRGKINRILLIVEVALLVLTGLLATYIAAGAIPSHLKMFANWAPFI